MLHLGMGAFFGIGAYITGILTIPTYPFQFGFIPALLAASLGAAFISVLISAPILRVRGDYFALVTLGFGEVIRFTLRNLEEITAGTKGLNPVPNPGFPFPSSINWADYSSMFFMTFGFLVLVLVVLRNLEHSRFGRGWVAIREDELAATCMGINSGRMKLLAFAIGAGLAGLAGALYAYKQGNTSDPDQYGFNASILALCCIILGGIGNRFGVLFGVVLVVGFDNIFSPIMDSVVQKAMGQSAPDFLRFSFWRLAVFGLALILVMRFRPSGLLPEKRN
jgi:branched-chain amino acid transport system permease protein